MKIPLIYIVIVLSMLLSSKALLCDNDDRVAPYTITVSGDVNLGVFVQGWSSPVFPPDNSITFTIKLNRKKPIDIMINNYGSDEGDKNDVKIETQWLVNNGDCIRDLSHCRHYKLTNIITVTVTITEIMVAKFATSGPRSFEQVLEVDMCF
ncbi:MAG: hypothetical protein HZB41_14455 [Ignavibacteriae bacterium]|nr:hypothetical protein [Ignavibacteriota bacterium]